MSEMNRPNVYTAAQDDLKTYILSVFTKMGLGLALTAAVAYVGSRSLSTGGFFASILFGNPWITLLLFVAQLGLCVGLSASIYKMNVMTTQILYYLYAIITGITFSVLPFVYDVGTLFTAFLFAAVLFGSCVVIGHTTNVDLSQFQGLLFGALLAMVITTVVSLFIPALRDSLWISYIGVILFLALTAFDMQKLKAFYYQTEDPILRENLSTYGAFQLYLDFINIFLYVLRILGNRRK